MEHIVVCDICFTPLAKVDLEKISCPMTPDMFESIDESRGIPAPFLPFQEFLTYRCRQCKARPFKLPDRLTILVNDFRKYVKVGDPVALNELLYTKKNHTQPVDAKDKKGKKDQPDKSDIFTCIKCGKAYKHKSSLARHKAACNG